jgi:hypothetical protein
MSIDFPPLPVASQTHADAGLLWRFDGQKWAASTVVPDPVMPSGTIVVSSSVTLSDGFTGTVLVNQTGPVTITLPASPVIGQAITVKDAAGQAGTHPITIAGLIEGVAGMTISFAYAWVSLTWAGSHWVQT